MENAENINMMCANCKVMIFKCDALQKCPICKLVYYCSEKCQRNHTSIHIEYCQQNGSQKRGTQEIAKILQSDDMWMMLTGALLHTKSTARDVLCCRIVYEGVIPDRKFIYNYHTVTDTDLPGAKQTNPAYWTVILMSINNLNIGNEQNDGLTISFLKSSCVKYYEVVTRFYPGMDLNTWTFPLAVDHYNIEYPVISTIINGQEMKIVM
jgi:hypothetical protein